MCQPESRAARSGHRSRGAETVGTRRDREAREMRRAAARGTTRALRPFDRRCPMTTKRITTLFASLLAATSPILVDCAAHSDDPAEDSAQAEEEVAAAIAPF